MASVSLIELKKAADALKESVEFCEANTSDKKLYKIARDASIQRFEFSVELSWKLSKKLRGSTSATAKPVVREMLQNELIDSFEVWFDFLEARNKTSHTYDEEIAKEVYSVVQKFLPELGNLIVKLENL